jgi:hypothetical protein
MTMSGITLRRPVMVGLALVALVAAATSSAAEEVHGTSDAFAGNGVAVAWAVLRGASDDDARVVLRIAADTKRYGALAADGVDPFSKERKPLVNRQPIGATTTVRFVRKQFAEFPRTELQFFKAGATQALTPELVVYYLGVPDTTPEFPAEPALDAYLDDRMKKLASGGDRK